MTPHVLTLWPTEASEDFPIVHAQVASANDVAGTSHSLALPSGIEANHLLLIAWNGAANDAYTSGTPSGWTSLYDVTQGNLRARAAYRVATGSEGASVGITFSAATRFSGISMRITRYTGAPQAGGAAGGDSAAPDPGSLTPSGGSGKILWLALAHSAAGGGITYPSGYTNGLSAYTGVFNAWHARTSVARRELEAASENPGTFGITDSVAWRAATIATRGA